MISTNLVSDSFVERTKAVIVPERGGNHVCSRIPPSCEPSLWPVNHSSLYIDIEELFYPLTSSGNLSKELFSSILDVELLQEKINGIKTKRNNSFFTPTIYNNFKIRRYAYS